MPEFFPNPDLFFSHLGIAADNLRAGNPVTIDGGILAHLISQALMTAPISTDAYLDYDDIHAAWKQRTIKDLQSHYATKGFFEHRHSLPEEFDAQWYAKTYLDVQVAIDEGTLSSAAAHYLDQGYREWRCPSADLRPKVKLWQQLLDQ